MKEIIKMTNIVKTFGEVQAIKNGNFNLFEGEIHSLIGENGAGKSTMMKILYGIYPIFHPMNECWTIFQIKK